MRPSLEALESRVCLTGGSSLLQCPPLLPTLNPWEPLSVPVGVSPLDPTLDPIQLPGGGDIVDEEGSFDPPQPGDPLVA